MSEAERSFLREVLRIEAEGILAVCERVDASMCTAVDAIIACAGQVIVSGMGKPGLVGAKISATFASTGTPSFWLHPGEALHGDLGRIRKGDLLVMLSNSGETEEITRLLAPVRGIGCRVIAITGQGGSTLARHADIVIDIGRATEACPLGLAPTTSTTVMLAVGDALALAVLKRRNFGVEEYARYHPGGSLGRQLMKTREVMRTGEALPRVEAATPVAEALVAITAARSGAALIVDADGRLLGIFTDGDFRRLFREGRPELDRLPVSQVMNAGPKRIGAETLATEALAILTRHRIDELPVVDDDGRGLGMVDIQDLAAAGFLR